MNSISTVVKHTISFGGVSRLGDIQLTFSGYIVDIGCNEFYYNNIQHASPGYDFRPDAIICVICVSNGLFIIIVITRVSRGDNNVIDR